MKSRKEMRKPAKDDYGMSDEAKKGRKLKPLKKEKNPKRAFLDEIDDLDDIDLSYVRDEFDDEDLFEDDEDY